AILPNAVILRERFQQFAGVHVKEAKEHAGLGAKCSQRFPVGRERQTRDAGALLSVHEAAKLLAGLHIPQACEVVLLLVFVTSARHQFAVRRERDCENAREAIWQSRLWIIERKITDRLAA